MPVVQSPGFLLDQQIQALLDPFGRFGVELGLERIQRLLAALGDPQTQVPLVHVAGTNGKGSVCAYLAAVLQAAGYRVGRYTSPHLVSWRERITVNNTPIQSQDLVQRLHQVVAAIDPAQPSPTQFEVFTAAAWLHFAQAGVDIAVMEVGLGGRLDATNVVDAPLVSVITSLSREHWQRLGPTLADIAFEKAGVLKSGRPAVIGPLPPEAAAVVKARLAELDCPVVWPAPAVPLEHGRARYGSGDDAITYPLPLLGAHQLVNSALAIAALHSLRTQGWQISDEAIVQGMGQARWPGRLQWVTWGQNSAGYPLLLDGAHNPAAAEVLRRYVDSWWASQPAQPEGTQWLMGMLATKDHRDIFAALLRPGDTLHLVPVPGHETAAPEDLAAIARSVCPNLARCEIHNSLNDGLTALGRTPSQLRVLCGSLYLIGHFLATEPYQDQPWPFTDPA
ncbi:bifunctional folylpolyglutamate synthase/dihydrofolate synthase [Nodosilinea sp. LEGE 06152]|uniref:bifunctional folylpolyglutamate synthase/dihydrofolate synthase n=1 Tax=Nodosilinea sp. LEGE 06152 TaxID=2777966 RepID=UPI00187F08B4|nr:folylpolyglutamate synthase/dihydrofolate synthase family protein [Nodosilinea sp. LEGE 06152]MBE9155937.1 bifunctional folylpolyglutamate synthase/dihydrofolate synthase [Nodosilinea sp. LEGE 06152]